MSNLNIKTYQGHLEITGYAPSILIQKDIENPIEDLDFSLKGWLIQHKTEASHLSNAITIFHGAKAFFHWSPVVALIKWINLTFLTGHF
jgi:hypothetical protein